MSWLLDLLYALAALAAAPVWLWRMVATGKIRTDWRGRLGRAPLLESPRDGKPRILFHAVSVGEVNAIRELVAALEGEGRDGCKIVIATTTNTGFARAQALYGANHIVVRYPLDFGFAVRRFLQAVQTDLVALVELEVWPNFTRECRRRGVPVIVVNGRLSARSFSGYRRFRPLVAPSFRRLAAVAAQDQAIAERFAALGVPRDRIQVVGTMKWDTASLADDVPGAAELASDLGIDRARPIVVAGSTGPGEERLVHEAVSEDVQLIVAPRKPERFDEAAKALPSCVRRSQRRGVQIPATERTRFLLDTLGELRAAYALADVVIVGRTFNRQHGSDMIEPVALGKATIVGPDVSNFEAPARALLDGEGLVQVESAQLAATVCRLLDDAGARRRLSENGRAVIRSHQGATQRHVELIRESLAVRGR